MEEMKDCYNKYIKENRGKVQFSENPKLTSYSFEVETLSNKKEGVTKKYVVMKSWFVDFGGKYE